MIVDQMSELFWMSHEDRLGAGLFSEEFKDLTTSLLQCEPAARMSIPDMIAHPWLSSKPHATPEEVRLFLSSD